jgi:antitoxin CcdA
MEREAGMVRSNDLYDPDAPKKATNLTLNVSLVEAARKLRINVSRACERGLQAQIAEVHAKQWREENKDAIASSNDYVERHGLPLDKFRRF